MPKKINIRAVYKNGLLTPLGHVDIEDGEVVSLTIEVEDKTLQGRLQQRRTRQDAGADSRSVDGTARIRTNQARSERS